MKNTNVTNLFEKYSICPQCNNDIFCSEAGTILIKDNYFVRTCTCGKNVIAIEENEKIIHEFA